MENTLVVISGCPASGKTTMVQELLKIIQAQEVKIDDILEEYQKNENFRPEFYHWSREALISLTENTLKEKNNKILIVEDTNHLKSLVKPFKRLAKHYQCKFLHILIKIPIEIAIERNNYREKKVDVEVLRKIFEQINSEKFFRETLEVKGDFDQRLLRDLCVNQINNAHVLRTYEKKIESNGIWHEIDIEIRRKINELVRNFQGNKKNYSEKLILEKKRLFDNIDMLNEENYEDIKNFIFSELHTIG